MAGCGRCQGGPSDTRLGDTRLKAGGLAGRATSLLGANGIVSLPPPPPFLSCLSLCLAAGGGGVSGGASHASLLLSER